MLPTLTLKAYEYIACIIAFLLLCFGLFGYGDYHGRQVIKTQWQASITAEALADNKLVHASDIVTTRVITQTIDRVNLVLTQGATITKETKVYVTAKADAQCALTVGFGKLLNAAAGGQALDAGTTGLSNDATLGTSLSDVAGIVSYNLVQCRADQERLRGLQGWVIGQQKLTTKNPP